MKLDKTEIEKIIEEKMEQYSKLYGKQFKVAIIEILSLEKALHQDEPNAQTKQEEMLIPLSKWNDYYPHPSVGSLRQSYFNRASNGFDYCVEYGGDNGGRILINVEKYHEWRKKRKAS